MTKKPVEMGMNRTGIKASPIDAPRSIEGAEMGTPDQSLVLEPAQLEAEHVSWSKGADPVGTMPPPATLKGAAKTALKALKGEHANVLLDRLSARAAFERNGVRLYEALMVKLEAAGAHPGGPSREDLEQIREDELRHYGMLIRAIEQLGGDPTVVSPSADITAVTGMGIGQALGDPRTTLTEGLEAILVAELADNDGWVILTDLAERMDMEDLADQFRQALADEDDHLIRVRQWLSSAVMGQAGIEATPPMQEAERPRPTR